MDVDQPQTNLCKNGKHDMEKRDYEMNQLEMHYESEQNSIDQTSIDPSDKQRNKEELKLRCNEKGQDSKDCAECTKFQQKLTQQNILIKELEDANKETRSELEELDKKHQVFRDRMSIEASVEIGTSGVIFEDISNPCRESELRSSYNKMKTTMWPKIRKEIEKKSKSSREEAAAKNEEKKRVNIMIKEAFTKAANDMMEKKRALETFFKISDKTTVNKKRLQCFEMAVQSLQLMTFWEEFTCFQDMHKQLGHSSPDYLYELADQWYKQGCLMELHNPPLTLDWDNTDDGCPFPPITTKSMMDIE